MTGELYSTTMSLSNDEKHALVSYSPDEQVFHRLFSQIPLSEKLIEARPCGLRTKKKKIVRMGKIYVSSLRFCFSSSFLSEPVMVCWDDVISVQKTAGLVFECVVVLAKAEEYMFSGFLTVGTDQMFKLLKTLWTVRARYALSVTRETPETITHLPSTEDFITKSPLLPIQPDQHTRPSTPPCIQSDLDRGLDLSSQVDALCAVPLTPSRDDESVPLEHNLLDNAVDVGSNARTPNSLLNDTESRRRTTGTPPASQVGDQEYSADKLKWLSYFPNLPQSETLIDDFQCSFVSGVHRVGRLFITTNYILFSSLMMSEKLQIRFKDVESILKEQTIVIFDGIVIKLKDGTAHSFTSFLSRDAAFKILTHFFNAVKLLRSPVQDSAPKQLILELEASGFATKTSESDISKFPIVESLGAFDDVATDHGTALSGYSCFTRELFEPVTLPEGNTLLDVFKTCFDDGSNLLELYHTERKDKNQIWEPWRPGGRGSPPFCGQRIFRCDTTIKVLVTKTCPFVEYHRYAFMNLGGNQPTLIVQLSGQATGVNFMDSFRAEALLIFTQNDSVVTMRVYGHIQFLRDVWLKKKILHASLDQEMPQCYRKLGAMLVERLQEQREGLFGNSDSKEVAETNLNAKVEHSIDSGCSYDIKYLFAVVMSFSVIFRLNFFIAAFGFLSCVNGLFTVLFYRFDDNNWEVHEGCGVSTILLPLRKILIDFFRPVVMSVLSVGMVVFYRLLVEIIVPAF